MKYFKLGISLLLLLVVAIPFLTLTNSKSQLNSADRMQANKIRPTATVISQSEYERRMNAITLGDPISEDDFIVYDHSMNKFTSYLNGMIYFQSSDIITARGISVGSSKSNVKFAYRQPYNTYYVTVDSFPISKNSEVSWVYDSLNKLCWEYRYNIQGEKVSLYFVFDQNQYVSGIGIWRRY